MPTRSASRGAHEALGANQGRAWQAQVAKVPHTDLAEPLAIACRYPSNLPSCHTRLRIATRLGPTHSQLVHDAASYVGVCYRCSDCGFLFDLRGGTRAFAPIGATP